MAGVCGRGSHSLYSNWEAGRGRRRVGEKRERERERERERDVNIPFKSMSRLLKVSITS
jgi:hypothetical protein